MLRFVVLALALSSAYAGGYGHGGGLALGGGLGLGGLRSYGNAGLGLGLRSNGYGRALPSGPITAAIQSSRSYETVPVALNYDVAVPQTIEVPPNVQPINFIFRTQSSPMNMQQVHSPAAPQYESTRSEDAPSVLSHEAYRPVIQEYKEVIQPLRNIVQQVQPVIENVRTVIAQGEQYRSAGYGAQALAAPLPLLAKADHY